jgi:hypothetical protein
MAGWSAFALMVELRGRAPYHVGRRPGGYRTAAKDIPCEVVGFSGNNALLMPFAPLEGVRRGCSPQSRPRPAGSANALGEPIDGKGPLLFGPSPYPFHVTLAIAEYLPDESKDVFACTGRWRTSSPKVRRSNQVWRKVTAVLRKS